MKQAAKAEAEGNTTAPQDTEHPACAGGCGFFAHTVQKHGYCCNACHKNTGTHGPHCERLTSAEQAAQAKVDKKVAKEAAKAEKQAAKATAKAEKQAKEQLARLEAQQQAQSDAVQQERLRHREELAAL